MPTNCARNSFIGIVVAVCLYGCSGNGGGGGSIVIPLSSQMRPYQLGDVYVWNVTGTRTLNGSSPQTLAGTRTFTVTGVSPQGNNENEVDIESKLSLSVDGGIPTASDSTLKYDQSTVDGSITPTLVSESGDTYSVTGVYTTPGKFSAGLTPPQGSWTETLTSVVNTGASKITTTSTNNFLANLYIIQPTPYGLAIPLLVNNQETGWYAWQTQSTVTDNIQVSRVTTTGTKSTATSTTESSQETLSTQWAPALGEYIQESYIYNLYDSSNKSIEQLLENYTLAATSVPQADWGGAATVAKAKRT